MYLILAYTPSDLKNASTHQCYHDYIPNNDIKASPLPVIDSSTWRSPDIHTVPSRGQEVTPKGRQKNLVQGLPSPVTEWGSSSGLNPDLHAILVK